VKLFKRRAQLTVGTLEITDLAMAFTVSKNLKAEPNHAKVSIRNLTESHRKSLEEPKTLPCRLEAGYEGGMHVLYEGEVRTAISVWDGPEVVTTVETGDGDATFSTKRVGLQVPQKATPAELVNLVGQALGVAVGNLPQALAGLNGSMGPATTVSGRGAEAFTQVCRSAGLEWSIQDGQLQVLKVGEAAVVEAVLLDSTSGLIGSPTVDNKGVLSAKALIMPGLMPGRPVAIDSLSCKGVYRIESVTFSGDTHGQSWYADIKARKT
jgi:hypothetical protein